MSLHYAPPARPEDTINLGPGDEIHDGFIKYMKKKGYDGLPDVRNAGSVSEDPIYVFQPKKFLKNLRSKSK